jgi:hypothetical protein
MVIMEMRDAPVSSGLNTNVLYTARNNFHLTYISNCFLYLFLFRTIADT